MRFECRNMSKSYGSVLALRNASLSVNRTEIHAILGGNGSGKSTLAKIIGGIVQPDTGEMFLTGQPYKVGSPSRAKQKRVVVTSQELSLSKNLTVAENLTLHNLPKKLGIILDKDEINKKALKVLERLGMCQFVDELVVNLPPNKQYLIEFAKALLQDPELLIIDEITSALYREDFLLFSDIVRDLSSKGCTVLFISHRMPEIFSLCSTVTVMRNGAVIATHAIKDVNEQMLLSLLTGSTYQHYTENNRPSDASEGLSAQATSLLTVKEMKIPSFNTTINLEVKRGEVIGIAGLQGQGQSELVRTLFGLNGLIQMTLDSEEKTIHSPRDAVKAGIVFISGDREREGVFYGRTIQENLSVINDIVLKRKPLEHKEVLAEVTVRYDSLSQPIEALSGGNQQKVVIGRGTTILPKLVLADDPTKGVDVTSRKDVHEILNKLAQSGSSIIFVSSDEEELVDLVTLAERSRVLVMYNGIIVKTFGSGEVTLHNLISASMPVAGGVAN